jgi:dihydroorotate dehydrogenase (NAD+) catalytic subunit
VRTIALAQVAAVAQRVDIPVVGMGGVARGQDALDLLSVGATLVAVGTENFRDPAAGSRVKSELAKLFAKCGIADRRGGSSSAARDLKPRANRDDRRNHPRQCST